MNIFGGFFDFDGDGKESLFETYLGMELLGFFDFPDSDDEDEEQEPDVLEKDDV